MQRNDMGAIMTFKRICRILSGEWFTKPWHTTTVPKHNSKKTDEIEIKFTICDDDELSDEENERHGINTYPSSTERQAFKTMKYGYGAY